ncbi:MiaB/RimO family radical SAM methylthiotransferase [Helicobacter aurati]|uniref:MiaB/RimO family radical SAM methylthiotransferase n=1 Tax=Helicobacter aurati TaxID=137778 RepID=UPI001F320EF8|nr:MiaB/RimO family radical SAM methylthiotransferase [Helicobacter aurati]
MFFKTFGCRSNLYDTQVMISSLKGYSLIEEPLEADIIVINSCTVTNKADREVRSYARKYSLLGKKVIFTGCGVKHLGESLYKQNLAFSVFAHSHKENISNILSTQQRVFLSKESKHKHTDSVILPNIVGRVRAFIKIQEGCNFSCSYCIIPSVRGVARSFTQAHILEQIRILSENGISEVILTGTNIGSYGLDTGTHIAELIAKIHDIAGIKRIRLGSLEPSQIDSVFLQILCLPKLEKHLHIALQHTSPVMLRIMNRKNTFERDLELFAHIAAKGFSLGTDYIVGHYGESEAIFAEALCNLEKLPLTHIHPFIYSPRVGTKSAQNKEQLESVHGGVAKKRLKTIQNIVNQKNKDFRMRIAQQKIPLQILIDGQKQVLFDKLDLESTHQEISHASRHHDTIKDNEMIESCYTGLDQYFNRVFIPHRIMESSHQLSKGDWIETSDYILSNYVNANIVKSFVLK